MQHKFLRKKDNTVVEQELKKSYERVLRSIFRILGLQRPKEDKIQLIQKEYQTVSDKDVERNEIFISVLVDLKKGVESKKLEKPEVWESFRDCMKLLKTAKIIDRTTFQELCGEIQEGFDEEPGLRDELTKRQRKEANKFLLSLIEMKEGNQLRREKDYECEDFIEDLKQIDFQVLDAGLTAEFWQMGSAKNGFTLVDSDYDVAISTNNMDSVDEREILNFFYREAKKILEKRYPDEFKIEKQVHEKIRIPIVNLQIYGESRIDISFTVNNELGVYNSHLLKTYSEFDPRCHDLGLLVKIWAQTQEVLSAKKNFLSSYAFMLMVINFLQTLKEPILPTLQAPIRRESNTIKIVRRINNDKIDNFKAEIDFESDPEALKTLKSKYSQNQLSNLDLLRKFFKFYSQEHKFGKIKLSIKKATHLPRLEREMDVLYSIEDPFDLFHNPGWPLKKNSVQAEKLLKVMRRSYEFLKQNKVREVFERIDMRQY